MQRAVLVGDDRALILHGCATDRESLFKNPHMHKGALKVFHRHARDHAIMQPMSYCSTNHFRDTITVIVLLQTKVHTGIDRGRRR